MIKVIKDEKVKSFAKATEGSAAYDLTNIGDTVTLMPGETKLISTGIKVDMTGVPGMYALVLPRSGISLKTYLRVANAPGLIDNDYHGEICVIMHNCSYNKSQVIESGARIAQLMFCSSIPVAMEAFALEFVNEFTTTTKRGEGGFGSTGV